MIIFKKNELLVKWEYLLYTLVCPAAMLSVALTAMPQCSPLETTSPRCCLLKRNRSKQQCLFPFLGNLMNFFAKKRLRKLLSFVNILGVFANNLRKNIKEDLTEKKKKSSTFVSFSTIQHYSAAKF